MKYILIGFLCCTPALIAMNKKITFCDDVEREIKGKVDKAMGASYHIAFLNNELYKIYKTISKSGITAIAQDPTVAAKAGVYRQTAQANPYVKLMDQLLIREPKLLKGKHEISPRERSLPWRAYIATYMQSLKEQMQSDTGLNLTISIDQTFIDESTINDNKKAKLSSEQKNCVLAGHVALAQLMEFHHQTDRWSTHLLNYPFGYFHGADALRGQ